MAVHVAEASEDGVVVQLSDPSTVWTARRSELQRSTLAPPAVLGHGPSIASVKRRTRGDRSGRTRSGITRSSGPKRGRCVFIVVC